MGKSAANVSRKRKTQDIKDDDDEGEESVSEAPPTKKSRGAPKKQAANVSKKRKSDDGDETAGEEVKPLVKKPRVDVKKAAPKPKPKQKPVAKPKAAPKVKPAVQPKVAVKSKAIINHPPEKKLNVYVMGEGSAGELGLGSAKGVTDVKRPRLNALLAADTVGVVQIAAGGMHAVALTHDNRILTWGVNDQGALGRDTTWGGGLKAEDAEDSDSDSGAGSGLNPLESTPTAVSSNHFPDGTVFVQVAAGDSVTVALTDEGLVYGWGTFRVSQLMSKLPVYKSANPSCSQSNEGILGFSAESHIQNTPTLIPGLKKITNLVCGENHVLALNDKGGVFAWGSGQQNQLGRRVVERTRMNGLVPREFGLPKNKIRYIECGAYHSFAIDKSGKVWTWGLNSYGETGISEGAGDDDACVLKPTLVKSLADKNITVMKGGSHHSLAVTANGECLVWGRMDGGQTGLKISSLPDSSLIKDEHNNSRILMTPTPISEVGKAVFVTAGSDHSIAINEEGKAYSWGFSATYQTGLGTTEDVPIATWIDNTAVRGKKLHWAGAGGQFSMLASYA